MIVAWLRLPMDASLVSRVLLDLGKQWPDAKLGGAEDASITVIVGDNENYLSPLEAAALAWFKQISSYPGMWAGEEEFAMLRAIRAAHPDVLMQGEVDEKWEWEL